MLVEVVLMYKKILLILVVILLIGCSEEEDISAPTIAKDQADTDVKIEEEVLEPAEEEKPEEPAAEEPEQQEEQEPELVEEAEEPESQLPERIEQLIEKSESITEFQYHLDSDQYFVIGNKTRIILEDSVGDVRSDEFDSLYNEVLIDYEKNKTYVWCTDSIYCSQKEDLYWEIPFSTYDVVTPVERLQSLTNAEIINERRCDNRDCLEIEFTDTDGIIKHMWILTYNPAAWKVQWYDESKGKQFTVLYQRIAFQVSDSDVIIPSDFEEGFN